MKKYNYTSEEEQREKEEKRNEVNEIKNKLMNYAHSKWGKEWVSSILKYGRPYRMRRALNYAQDKRISNLRISPGSIFASVQGTAPVPYRVKINFTPIEIDVWKEIISKISERINNIVQLVDNVLPDDILDIVESTGHSLFPSNAKEIDAHCSCPDKEIPCKHIACVILYIARVVDFNPFIILTLRGMTKEDFFKQIKSMRINVSLAINKNKSLLPNEEDTQDGCDFNVPSNYVDNLNVHHFLKGKPYNIGFQIKKPQKNVDTLTVLKNPPNLDRQDTFSLGFKNIYFSIIKTINSWNKQLENIK